MKKEVLFVLVFILSACAPTGAKITPSSCGTDSTCIACTNNAHYCSDGYEMAWGYANGVCNKGYVFNYCSLGCSNGQCISDCQNECSLGQIECIDDSSLRACANFDSDPCYEWKTLPCSSSEVCQNGECISTCQDKCNPGDKYCFDSSTIYRCSKQSNGCYDYSYYSLCGSSKKCESGACVTIPPTDPCADVFCTSNQYCEDGRCIDNEVFPPPPDDDVIPPPPDDDKSFFSEYGVISLIAVVIIGLIIYYFMNKKGKKK